MAPSNPDDFDGYRKWLGIASRNRIPTYYELLAISLDEDDPDVIQAAADQRRQYVESKKGLGHDDLVTEIVYRINEAESTLLNTALRRDYDRKLDLFEKRQKSRQFDPTAPRSRIRSRPGQTGGEYGIAKSFAAVMAVFCIGFGVMAWFSFQLPWAKKAEQKAQPAAAPAAQVPVAAPPAQVAQVSAPVVVPPQLTQAPEPANPVVEQIKESVKDVPPAPEIVNVEEINTENSEFSPWLSEDGLTIYWDANDREEAWIWTASRKDKDSLFGEKAKLFRGRFPLVSSDGLEIIFKSPDFDGFSVATRKAASDSFGRPSRIFELKVDGLYANPRCLSHDGLSLYFDLDKVNGGKGNDTWIATRRDRSSQWQKPTQLAIDVPGIPKNARFTQVCLTKDELHLFGLAALPQAGGQEDIRPGVLSRSAAGGPFTKYQPLIFGEDSSEPLRWAVPRYVESTKELFVLSNAHFRKPELSAKRKLDIWIVKNMDVPALREPNSSLVPPETVVHWKFWDVFGKGAKKDSLIVSRDGMLLSPAHEHGFCLTTLKEYSGLDLKLEFQFQSGDGMGNPYVGIASTLPNPAASDWKQQIPRSVEIKLDPKNAGELVLPTSDFKVKLVEVQKIHNSRHIAPINRAEVKLREWNTLEIKCNEDRKLVVKINGVTVNRLEGMQSIKGHVVIWAANSEMRLRNAVAVSGGTETKLHFDILE